jgi:type IV fimbrial biogenesis protein FimT
MFVMIRLNRNGGVTLVELLMVLVIAAILLVVGVPAFTSFVNDTRLSSNLTQLVSDLNQTRSEAIKRNTRVLICVRNVAGTDCGTGTNWQNGWLVCYDANNDDACDASAASNPNPINKRLALAGNLSLTGPAAVVRFNPNGTQGTGGAAIFTLTGTWAGAASRTVTIAATGNISRN